MISENQVAAILILLLASFGMSCNWFIVFFIHRTPSLKNSFGRLLASQATAEAVHLTIFALFVSPMTFFDVEGMKSISQHFGHVLLICYDICIYCHLFIALNRMTAIFLPTKYNTFFSKRNTLWMIVVAWTLSIVPSFYFYIYEDCHFYYIGDYWHFVFSSNDICNFITWYTDFMKYVTIVIVIVIVDIITVLRVHTYNKTVSSQNADNIRQSRRTEELNFLKQACLQAAVFVCELLTYFVIIGYVEHKWVKFFLSTFAWISVHTLDGVITIMFNRELRQKVYDTRSTWLHSHSGVTPAVRSAQTAVTSKTHN